jgi:hypothetical protein
MTDAAEGRFEGLLREIMGSLSELREALLGNLDGRRGVLGKVDRLEGEVDDLDERLKVVEDHQAKGQFLEKVMAGAVAAVVTGALQLVITMWRAH